MAEGVLSRAVVAALVLLVSASCAAACGRAGDDAARAHPPEGPVDGGAAPDAPVEADASDPAPFAPSLLPKTAPATALTVLDLARDLAGRDATAKEAYEAMLAIQGLVNRTSHDKIFFTHSPPEWGWYLPADSARNAPADQGWLDAGLLPVPRSAPALDTTRRFPALSYLVHRYASALRGTVAIPAADSPAALDGTFAAAFTACGILDAIPASPAIDAYLEAEGVVLPRLADTRGLTSNAQAFDWAYQHYYTVATGRQLVASYAQHGYGESWNVSFPSMLDYWIAHRSFVYALDASDPMQEQRLDQLLRPERFAYGTPVLGALYSEGRDVMAVEQRGYPHDIAMIPDTSATSAFPSLTSALLAPPPPSSPPPPLDANGVYVGFYVTDGDSLGIASVQHFMLWEASPSRGLYPMGWSTNVQLFDLFPTLLEHYSQNTYGGRYELIADSFHVGRAAGAGAAPTIARYRHYRDLTNGVFGAINLAPALDGASWDEMMAVASGAGFPVYLEGYAGDTPTSLVGWDLPADPPLVHTRLTGATQTAASADSVGAAIARNATAGVAGEPVFAVVAVGDGLADEDCQTYVKDAVARVDAGVLRGRTLHVLRPTEVAAAWRRWQKR